MDRRKNGTDRREEERTNIHCYVLPPLLVLSDSFCVPRKTEVTKLQIPLTINQEVSGLDVPMNDPDSV